MMLPTIHTNGTAHGRLLDDALGAAEAIRDAIAKHAAIAPNGRDYYPQGPNAIEIAQREHASRASLLVEALLDLERYVDALADLAPPSSTPTAAPAEQRQVSDYVTVPAGTYLCRVTEVRPGTTRAADERWSMRLVVAEGEHVGKQAAWDSIVFSTRGRIRARMVLQALGLPASGKVQVEPKDLEGRTALVEIRPAEYQTAAGEVVRRNEVPYDGWRGAGA
ncbi:MAG: hypothetical protein WAT39_01925 [Planctomycetota bacterium]